MPLVTVLMPVHNGALYLREAVDSIFSQSLTDFELLIVDDFSDDETPSIITSYSDSRLRYIQSEQRLMLVGALNLGLSKARGDFIARMDADDVCHPRRLERQIRFLQKHPDIGFCGSWVRRFGINQQPQKYRRPVGSMRVRAFAVYDNPIVHSSVIFRREVLRHVDVAYRDDFAHAEDFDLWTRLLEITEGYNLPDVLLDYRVHIQSVTLQKSEEMDRTSCRVLKRELNRLGLNATNNEVVRHRMWATGRLDLDNILRDIDAAENWLLRLLEANSKSLTYDSAAFLWATREIWFALCYRVQAADKSIMKRFIKSPISKGNLKDGAILLGAITKRRLSIRA